MKKNYFLTMLALLFLFSCTREYLMESNDTIQVHSNSKVNKVSFEEMESFIQTNAKNTLPNYLKPNNLNKNTKQYITAIDTADIIKVVHNDITSFTLKVNTVDDKDFTFSNLVINVHNGNIEEYIYNYIPDAQWLKNYIINKKGDYQGVLKITDINGNNKTENHAKNSTTCMVEMHVPCYGASCPCSDWNGMTYYIMATCTNGGGGSSGGSTGGNPGGPPSGGGGGTVPNVPTTEQINNFIAFLSLSSHAYITENIGALTDITNYFSQNGLAPRHQGFITSILEYVTKKDIAWSSFNPIFTSAVVYINQNPNTTWEQYENWFITKSDSQSMEYDNGISDAVFSQQTFQQHSLPKMSDYELAFPSKPNLTYPDYYRDAESNINVYNNYVGGRLKAKFNEGPMNSSNELWNACATRQSYAHNKLGIMIPFQHNDLIGDNNWNYIVKASTMGIFLEKTYGAPTYKLIGADANDKNKIAKFLEGKTGIYLSINNDRSLAGFSGHTDMIKNGYVSGGANVTNSNGNIVNGGIKYIYIWELK